MEEERETGDPPGVEGVGWRERGRRKDPPVEGTGWRKRGRREDPPSVETVGWRKRGRRENPHACGGGRVEGERETGRHTCQGVHRLTLTTASRVESVRHSIQTK